MLAPSGNGWSVTAVTKLNPRKEIERLVAYDAPEPAAEVVLVANENPDNVPAPVLAEVELIAAETAFNRYPDPQARELRGALAEANGVTAENIITGNGGDEILMMTSLAFGGAGRAALTLPPTFSMFAIIGITTGTTVREVPRAKDFSIELDAACEAAADADIVFLANPNNPTGNFESRETVEKLARAAKGIFVLDEAYCEFAGTTYADMLDEYENLLVLRTFSKAFSMAGLRVGYALGGVDLIGELHKVRLPYNSNAFSQAVATAALKYREHFQERIDAIVAERERVIGVLADMAGVRPHPSCANYVLMRVNEAPLVWQKLLDSGVLVRSFPGDDYLDSYLRVTIGSRAENDRFLAALGRALPRWAE